MVGSHVSVDVAAYDPLRERGAYAGRAILVRATDDLVALRVPGLHCEGRVASIRSVLEQFPGAREVEEVEGDL